MAKILKEYWEIENVAIPINIYREWRNSNRISIGKKEVNLRIPKVSGAVLGESYKTWATNWLTLQFKKKPALLDRFKPKSYSDGQKITIADRVYSLSLNFVERDKSTARLREGVIYLVIDRDLPAMAKYGTIHKLIAKILALDNHERVKTRIQQINDYHFKKEIKSVRIKNNTSNWGSCSSSGNLNISVRSLFAPLEVQDYLYVHELAHLCELNHSPKYWSIVKSVMPDYKKKELWLKKNGALCDF